VTVLEAACSSTSGQVELRLSSRHGGHAVGKAKPGDASLQVPATTLDEILADAGLGAEDVGLVWMDVGGHEEEVLRGGASLLGAAVPIVVEIRARTAPGIERLLAGLYSRAVDLRAEIELPVTQLSAHLSTLGARGGRKFSDFLLL
jgi:Methyltransferase FkbM domain